MIRSLSLGLAVLGGVVFFGAQDASAGNRGYGFHGRHGGHGGHGGQYNVAPRSFYRGSWGGFGFSVRRQPHLHWHDTSHYDYHPGQYVPHGNHLDYVPGHYDFHQDGHYDVH